MHLLSLHLLHLLGVCSNVIVLFIKISHSLLTVASGDVLRLLRFIDGSLLGF